MLHLVNVHWSRRSPHPDKPAKGKTTYAEYGRTFIAARSRAVKKFNRHYGTNLAITSTSQVEDPAGILS
jgi:hypothetical protein